MHASLKPGLRDNLIQSYVAVVLAANNPQDHDEFAAKAMLQLVTLYGRQPQVVNYFRD